MEMQCDNADIKVPKPSLNELDSALQELGMLASSTNSRSEYLNEVKYKPNCQYLNMLVNTKYVSDVAIKYHVKPSIPHVRYKPYKLPKERHRTKSENNDGDSVSSLAKSVVESCIDESLEEICLLKKAKSLESIAAETNKSIEFSSWQLEAPQELEQVSHSIQNLRVAE